jgi:hypothetical protein
MLRAKPSTVTVAHTTPLGDSSNVFICPGKHEFQMCENQLSIIQIRCNYEFSRTTKYGCCH